MGYKRNRKIYHLVWADGEYEGLEVNVRTLNIGQLIEAKTGKGVNGKDGLEGNVELLASLIVDWNLEDEVTGEPVGGDLVLSTWVIERAREVGCRLHVADRKSVV